MPRSSDSDEELAKRAREGDEQAAAVLFDRWLPRLKARVQKQLRGILKRRVGASDVVQEAYLAAFLRMEDFEDRGDGSFGRWLGKILECRIQDQVRLHVGAAKRSARLEVTQGDGGQTAPVADRAPSPSVAAMGEEQRLALRRGVETLPEHFQTVLRLVHEERLPLAEVGRRTGRSADAAGKVYARAVRALGDLLAERERG